MTEMNEQHADQPRGSVARWVWRVLYIISPAAVWAPLWALGSVAGQARQSVDLSLFVWLFIWIVFVTLLLIFKWRDFVFLAWGAPLALAVLLGMIIVACEAELLNEPRRVLQVPTEAFVFVVYAAAILPGFVVGLVGSIERLFLWLRSRTLRSE